MERRHGVARHGLARRGTQAWLGRARQSEAWHGTQAKQGMARQGMAWPGLAGNAGWAWLGQAWHGTQTGRGAQAKHQSKEGSVNFDVTNGATQEAEVLNPGASAPVIPKGALVLPSMAEIRKGIEKFEQQVARVRGELATFEIRSDDDLSAAVDTRQQAKEIFSSIEDAIGLKVAPAKKLASDANAIVRHFRELLLGDKKKGIPGVVGALDERILLYQRKKQIAEQEAQRKRDEDIRRSEDDLRKEAEEKGLEPPPPLPAAPRASAPQKTHSTTSGAKATIVERWAFDEDFVDFETLFAEALRAIGYTVEKKDPNFKPVDADLVLLRYVRLDSKEINAAIAAGTREIPGIHIFKKEHVR